MAEFDLSSVIWRKCVNWAEGDSHGGAMSTNAITDDTDENVFDDVTNAERISGMTSYRKVYYYNSDTEDTFYSPVITISENTPAQNDTIYILRGGNLSKQGASVQCTGTATFTYDSATVTTTAAQLGDLREGEKIYNLTDDTPTNAIAIQSISGTTITLVSPYLGTGGSGKNFAVAPITGCTFVQTALTYEDLAPESSIAVWIKEVVTGNINTAYTGNTAKLKLSGGA